MINLHDLGMNFASKAHNERIKHAQMLCNFTMFAKSPKGNFLTLIKNF